MPSVSRKTDKNPPMNEKVASRLALPIFSVTFFRLVINTSRRFAYPYAPALSRGLGVSLSAITSIIAINQVTSVIGALIGPYSDRLGYRRVMIVGMILLGLGMLAAAVFPFYAVVLIALMLAGLSKSVFDPAVQAWASDQVAYRHRGLVIGIIEMAWAGSTLIGIPLVAVLMDRFGWQAPFFIMGGLGIVGSLCLFLILPNDPPQRRQIVHERFRMADAYKKVLSSRPALGAMGFAFFTGAANDSLFVVYGAWLEKSLGLNLLALGLGTSVIGIAELSGEALAALISDRLGLGRSVIIGCGLSAIGYFALPFCSSSLPVALTALGVLFLLFEFAIVSNFSLCSEMLPNHRATMMSCFLAMAGIGRAVGALMGGMIWQNGGILAIGSVSGLLTLVGLGCLMVGLRAGVCRMNELR